MTEGEDRQLRLVPESQAARRSGLQIGICEKMFDSPEALSVGDDVAPHSEPISARTQTVLIVAAAGLILGYLVGRSR